VTVVLGQLTLRDLANLTRALVHVGPAVSTLTRFTVFASQRKGRFAIHAPPSQILQLIIRLRPVILQISLLLLILLHFSLLLLALLLLLLVAEAWAHLHMSEKPLS
jgi:hypothetical protein